MKTQVKSSKKRFSFRLKKDKSESTMRDRLMLCETSSSPMPLERALSAGEGSVDTLSLNSRESSGFDELSDVTMHSTSSSSFYQPTESSSTQRSNTKPARKLLRKSASMPINEPSDRLTNGDSHSKSNVPMIIGSHDQADQEVDCSGKS